VSGGVRQRLARALDRRFESLHHRVERLAGDVEALRTDVAAVRADTAAVAARLEETFLPALRILAGRDAESRRLLAAARADAAYELAYTEPRPLVTIVLPTFRRASLLRERSLPAALGQTYERLEVLVIGDGPDPEAEEVVRETGDERARWVSLPQRYVYPDGHRHWLAVSTLTRNEGYRLAQGRWLFDFDDDDSLPPDAVESLLEAARERRAEAVQGVLRSHHPSGSTETIAVELPDRLPLKGALVHAHLRFFEREHVASALGAVGDWFRGERMLRAGARIELVDTVAYEYYPSTLWQPRAAS
jgi:outer membrane murein-binding lipoprotein Lpp